VVRTAAFDQSTRRFITEDGNLVAHTVSKYILTILFAFDSYLLVILVSNLQRDTLNFVILPHIPAYKTLASPTLSVSIADPWPLVS
jgi:hypothetical protein